MSSKSKCKVRSEKIVPGKDSDEMQVARPGSAAVIPQNRVEYDEDDEDVAKQSMTVDDHEGPGSRPRLLSSEMAADANDDDADDDDDAGADPSPLSRTLTTTSATSPPNTNMTSSSSRLFARHRTIGVVCSGRPFDLVPHQSSAQALLCCPIGDRFQLLQTDRLHPVLVSQAVTTVATTTTTTRKRQRHASGERRIQHVVTDPSLSITLVTHGAVSMASSSSSSSAVSPKVVDTVTLYNRTRPIASQYVLPTSFNDNWTIQTVVSMGRMAIQTDNVEKGNQTENAAIVTVVLAKYPVDEDDMDDEDDNDSDDDSENEHDMVEESDEENDEDNDGDHEKSQHCMGLVVVLVCTRTSLRIQRRIWLDSIPTFRPVVAMHPATYLNKIVLGGSLVSNSSSLVATKNSSSSSQSSALCLVNIRSGKVVHVFSCLSKAEAKADKAAANQIVNRSVSALEQAPALDTVAVGTNYGTVFLINLKHDKLLFTLQHKAKTSSASTTSSSPLPFVKITSISFRTDSAALQYGIAPMAVGRSDGCITIWDLTAPSDADMGRTILCEMNRIHAGGVSKLQYFPQEALLISTGVSSNAIFMHIFDNPDYSARLLRQRRGHMAPPTCIRYLHAGAGAGGGVLVNASDGTDASSCQILSSGGWSDQTLRVLSTARTVLDAEYSQGPGLERKARKLGLDSTAELLLPPLTAMAMSEARSREWGDLVTIHHDHALAYVWSTRRKAQSGPVLRQVDWNVSAMKQPPPRSTHATAVCLSACGSFAVIGTRGGTIYRYNVQSGIARGSYPRHATSSSGKKSKAIGDVNRTTKALEKTLKTTSRPSNLDRKLMDAQATAKRAKQIAAQLRLASHAGSEVTGLAVDIVNKTLISVGADAKLILWNFHTHAPHKKSPYNLPSPATRLCHVRDSDLAAIALHDCSVVLFDCAALSIVRRFGAVGSTTQHAAHVSDLCFSPDGRSLYTASLDGTIRVWDVPTNKCVDWLGFQSPPTSLTMSPTGEFLATTHANKLGISIWSDKSFYQTVHMDGIELTQPARMDDPVPLADDMGSTERHALAASHDAMDANDTAPEDAVDDSTVPAVPRELGLITLSGLPQAHWKNLFHLELVRSRNKPIEPPKKPPTAPFFLQWRSGEAMADSALEGDKAAPKAAQNDEDEEWAAAWTDDGDEDVVTSGESKMVATVTDLIETTTIGVDNAPKRRKVTHHRSHLAHLLKECSTKHIVKGERRFQPVTDHMASLGPSAIDVAISSLCNGMHDLSDGLPLLILSSQWLLEACVSRERYEAVNAYLHRFLHLHAIVIAGIEDSRTDSGDEPLADPEEKELERKNRTALLESVSRLRQAQQNATEALRGKMEHTLCLLRHFSRMV